MNLSARRFLSAIHYPYPGDMCEMGDEDGCPNSAAFYLTADASYVKPMLLCTAHADEEHFYNGTVIPERAS